MREADAAQAASVVRWVIVLYGFMVIGLCLLLGMLGGK